MPYLIDGHNLIGQLPDIDLADPDDEVKLVLKLRRFAGQVSKRVTVVFDNGLPAGIAKGLSTHSVQVRFASERSSADRVLRDMIRKLQNPSGWILVSSDAEIAHQARSRRMQVISSHDFVRQIDNPVRRTPGRKPRKKHDLTVDPRKADPRLSQRELDEWLALFDSAPDD